MVDVLVTVGIFSEFTSDMKTVKMSFPAIPAIGDMILPNTALSQLIEEKRNDWKMSPYVRLNYVRGLAYQSGGLPIVMLSTSPKLLNIDLCYDNQYMCSTAWDVLPSIGDAVYVHTKQQLFYVKSIEYSSEGPFISVWLSNRRETPSVYVENSEFDVNVSGCHVDLDVNVRNIPDVNIVSQRRVLDVRTRREDND